MLGRLVDLALRQRLLALFAAIGILAWGIDSYRKLPIDAFPDVSSTQVKIIMKAPGMTPEEIENTQRKQALVLFPPWPSQRFQGEVTEP